MSHFSSVIECHVEGNTFCQTGVWSQHVCSYVTHSYGKRFSVLHRLESRCCLNLNIFKAQLKCWLYLCTEKCTLFLSFLLNTTFLVKRINCRGNVSVEKSSFTQVCKAGFTGRKYKQPKGYETQELTVGLWHFCKHKGYLHIGFILVLTLLLAVLFKT